MHTSTTTSHAPGTTRRHDVQPLRTGRGPFPRPRETKPCLQAFRGDIRLRPLRPGDAHHVTALLERLSPRSRYLRYFRILQGLSPAEAARFVSLTPDHVTIGAFDGGDLVGAAQYFRSAVRRTHAEVALEVADSHHRRGIGARLVDALARRAAAAGITHLTATVLSDNRAVLELIRSSGWDTTITRDGSYAEVVMTLPPGIATGCR